MFDKKEIEKLIKNSANYWEKRALSSKLNIMENEEDYLKRITSIYDEARRQIDDKLAATYGRYGKENKLTLKEAYKKLPSAIEKEYKNDVDDYIKKAESGDPKWRQYLLNQSIMHKHTVLNQLQTEYRKVIYDIDMEETGGLFLEKIFTNSNYQNQFARYQAGYDDPFAKVDKTKIKNLIEQDWVGGEGFSNRIWKNKQLLIDSLDDIVIKGLATGTSIDKMSNELAKKMDTAVSNAKRLIMTESARMDNEALLDRYKTTGEKQLQFVATLDMKTSEICRIMDGTIINIDDAQIGLNVPPLHPYCRSVMIAYHPEMGEIEERAYRDTETGKTKMGSYKNYGDYLVGELNDKKQAEALISTRNDLQTLIKAAGTSTAANTSASTSEQILNRYYDDLYSSEPETLELIKQGQVYKQEKAELDTILNDEEATDSIKVDGIDMKLNLHKDLADDQISNALMQYIEDSSINDHLRGISEYPVSGKDLKKIEDIVSALKKLPDYKGTVYRFDDMLDEVKKGDIIEPKSFYSTSKDLEKLEEIPYFSTRPTKYVIESKTGKSLPTDKAYTNENEVLFNYDSKFKVTKVTTKNKKRIIYMKEV